MKKILSVIILASMLVTLLAGCGNSEKPVLKVYNAGEYIDKSLLTDFEQEANCKIVYETFESNEAMYTKICSGEQYDVIIPSDYMIEKLIKEDYLQPIDWSKITNKDGLLKDIMNNEYDPNNQYSVPYFWGSVGILYDKTVVDKATLESEGWNILCDTKYKDKLYMYDSERDSFMVALKALGYSMNTTNPDEINKAYEWLINQNETMAPIYVGDEVIDNMISGNKAMAIVYSGDAAYIMTENENLEYYTPKSGTNIWIDSMIIPKNSKQSELAHQFINFMISEENALKNSEAVGYSSSVKSAYEEMKNTVYEGIEAYTPDTTNKNNELFKYQDNNTKKLYAELWTKIKSK